MYDIEHAFYLQWAGISNNGIKRAGGGHSIRLVSMACVLRGGRGRAWRIAPAAQHRSPLAGVAPVSRETDASHITIIHDYSLSIILVSLQSKWVFGGHLPRVIVKQTVRVTWSYLKMYMEPSRETLQCSCRLVHSFSFLEKLTVFSWRVNYPHAKKVPRLFIQTGLFYYFLRLATSYHDLLLYLDFRARALP